MKYFTRSLFRGDYMKYTSEDVYTHYANHLDSITTKLSSKFNQYRHDILIRKMLHDAQFIEGMYSHRHSEISIIFRCGDKATGYYDLKLKYKNVDISSGLHELQELLHTFNSEILAEEIDLSWDYPYEHRLLFHPSGEVAIRFTEFDYSLNRVDSRHFTQGTFKIVE